MNNKDKTMTERLNSIAPRFTEPSENIIFVMPVGTGDLSAMVRYDQALDIHLSKSDFYAFDPKLKSYARSIQSPGHVRLSFGVPPESVQSFEQRLDLNRGSVVVTIETAQGRVKAEIFGVMGRNALLVAVEDARSSATAAAEFSIWRPTMTVTTKDSEVVTREVHDYDENGASVTDASKIDPFDRMFRLGVSTALAFSDGKGKMVAQGATAVVEGSDSAGTLRASPGGIYWLVIACATTYDEAPEKEAGRILETMLSADKTALRAEQLAWWRRFWQASFIDLHGTDAEYLTRVWHVAFYSHACTAGTPHAPMKFNGGAGLIRRDERTWGWGYWFQNTRELIWPLLAANRADLAHAYLDFYDRQFALWKKRTTEAGKIGIRVYEGALPFHPAALGTQKKCVSAFDPAALQAAIANRTMEDCKPGYNARSLDQAAEFVQLVFDYVAYTGDAEYLRRVVSPWLKEAALFFLSYLKLESDGFYHMTPSDAIEMWWKVKDPMTDLCAVRYIFWKVLNHGEEFGYEPEFVEAVRERTDKLPPLPTGRWVRGTVPPTKFSKELPYTYTDIVDRIEPTNRQYAPAAALLDDRVVHNVEHPELYVVYPLAMVDANSPKADYERAVNTFRARAHPNVLAWSQCPVQAARLRLPDTVDVILSHARQFQRFPYGGWTDNAGCILKMTYCDGTGVNMTAIQEALLQCHTLTTPDKTDPFAGGPIRLLPAVRADWSGRFRLRARGGFLVTAVFGQNRTLETVSIESERGGLLTLVNPYEECRVSKGGEPLLTTRDDMIRLPTQPGDIVEFIQA